MRDVDGRREWEGNEKKKGKSERVPYKIYRAVALSIFFFASPPRKTQLSRQSWSPGHSEFSQSLGKLHTKSSLEGCGSGMPAVSNPSISIAHGMESVSERARHHIMEIVCLCLEGVS